MWQFACWMHFRVGVIFGFICFVCTTFCARNWIKYNNGNCRVTESEKRNIEFIFLFSFQYLKWPPSIYIITILLLFVQQRDCSSKNDELLATCMYIVQVHMTFVHNCYQDFGKIHFLCCHIVLLAFNIGKLFTIAAALHILPLFTCDAHTFNRKRWIYYYWSEEKHITIFHHRISFVQFLFCHFIRYCRTYAASSMLSDWQ